MRAHGHVDIDVAEGPDTVLDAVESHLRALRAQVPRRRARAGGGDRRARSGRRPARHPGAAADHARAGTPTPSPRACAARSAARCCWRTTSTCARSARPGRCPRTRHRCCSSRSAPGIGGGLITGAGELHHGADGAAGDIGHVRVRGGPDVRCVCGNVGCIEALASAGAIARRLGAESGGEATIADVRALVARGDPTVLAARAGGRRAHRRGRRHARALLQPGAGHHRRLASPPRATTCSPGIRSVVYQRALPLATRNLVLANSVLGEFAGVAGAAVLGIEQALSADGIGVLMDAAG